MFKKALFFVYLALITALSLWPSNSLPDVVLFPYADKLIHAGMYAGFAFLMLWAWPLKFSGFKQFLPLLIVIVYGLLMETLQRISFLGRSFDLSDELANSLGFFPGWLFWKFVNYINK
jgi:VanZ family protein